MTTDEILDALEGRNAYINFNDEKVRISDSEATRVVQALGADIDANKYPNSLVLFVPDGTNTGIPTGGLPSADALDARQKIVELYQAVDGNGSITLTDPVETRYDQVITDLYISDGELVAKLTNDETDTLTGLTRTFSSHVGAATLQDMIDDVNAQT